MNRVIGQAILISFLGLSLPSLVSADGEKIMVFRDAEPYELHREAIEAAMVMLREFAAENEFSIDTTVNLSSFNSANLAKYDAVLMNSPMKKDAIPDTMSPSQDSAFQNFLRSGKGFIGLHDIDRLNNNSDWYHKFAGVLWKSDKGPQNLTFHVTDTSHPMTKGIPQTFTCSQQPRYDSLFFSDTSKGWTVLIEGDDKDFPSRRKQDFYPFVWTHEFEGARAWFGMMGHIAPTYSDTIWRKLVLNGILYALNRPGFSPTTKSAEPFRPVFRNSEEWTLNLEQNSIVRIFDLTGRTAGTMPRSSRRHDIFFVNEVKLSAGTYIVASFDKRSPSTVSRMPVMR